MSSIDHTTVEDEYVEKVLATWSIRTTDAQYHWLAANADKLNLHYADKLEFIKLRDGRFAVVVHQFAKSSRTGGRFLTPCPHGIPHAAREMVHMEALDELPPAEVLYAPEPEHHRFDDE